MSRPRSATRLSYAAIASALLIEQPLTIGEAYEVWKRTALALADVLGAGNLTFNRRRFLTAAGVL